MLNAVAVTLRRQFRQQPFARIDPEFRVLDICARTRGRPFAGAIKPVGDVQQIVGNLIKADQASVCVAIKENMIAGQPVSHGLSSGHRVVTANRPQAFAIRQSVADLIANRLGKR